MVMAAAGAVLSAGILLLLLIPGMPGAMGKESWMAFAVWILLGVIFYLTVVRRSPKRETPEA